MARKTVDIAPLKERINERISQSQDENVRKELCLMLEFILFDADAYKGFQYINGWHGVEDYRHRYS